MQPGNAGCHLDSGAVQLVSEAGRRLVESLDHDLGPRQLLFALKPISVGYTDTSINLIMSTEFEEKITKQTSVYRTLGQGLKTLRDHQYADVE
jgi:hypothetical protein